MLKELLKKFLAFVQTLNQTKIMTGAPAQEMSCYKNTHNAPKVTKATPQRVQHKRNKTINGRHK